MFRWTNSYSTFSWRSACQSLSIVMIAVLIGCGSPEAKKETRGLTDIENALKVIRERQEAEERIISDQLKQIEVLEANVEKSRTEGMKDHIRKEIEMKKLAIEKARRNIVNQNLILEQLQMKVDSLRGEGRANQIQYNE